MPDMKLELVPIGVSDVDRAKDWYTNKAGFDLNVDVKPMPDLAAIHDLSPMRTRPRDGWERLYLLCLIISNFLPAHSSRNRHPIGVNHLHCLRSVDSRIPRAVECRSCRYPGRAPRPCSQAVIRALCRAMHALKKPAARSGRAANSICLCLSCVDQTEARAQYRKEYPRLGAGQS